MKKIINKVNNIGKALDKIFSDFLYKFLALSFGLNFLALDYIIFSQSTTFRIFFTQNYDFYNYASIILSIIIAIFFALSITMLVYIFEKQKESAKESTPTTFVGVFFGAIASGCPVCGSWLLSIFGIAGSLAIFPFQGLEIKILAILLLIFSVYQSSNIILGICKTDKDNVKRRFAVTMIMIFVFIAILFLLPNIPQKYKVKFQRIGVSAPTVEQINFEADVKKLYEQVNPKEGFEIAVNYGNIGFKLIQDGAIDFEKFSALYDRVGSPLTKEQLAVFSEEGLNKPIIINRENSYFLLNLFWAFGLANENTIITDGEISKYGKEQIGRFASTGGWTIAKKPLTEFMAKSKLAPLTKEQQELLEKVTRTVYRPCCGNSTAFPDCNHGMALLGVLELMASNGASEEELFEAAKYFSAYWFPNQALDVATFFMITENKDFTELDAKTFVSKQYFSGRGWSQVKKWLEQNVDVEQQQTSNEGGGCGV